MFAAITPNDSADLSIFTRAIYVGVAGDVACIGSADGLTASIVFKAVPAGTVLPVAARRVFATGTTATNLVALY